MPDFDVRHAGDISVLLEFKADLYAADPSQCVLWYFFSKKNNESAVPQKIDEIADAELMAFHGVLHSLLYGTVKREIARRENFDTQALQEIDQLTQPKPPHILEALMTKALIPFKSKGAKKDSTDGAILDHGELGSLKYEVYERGVIHIFDDNLMCHKDISRFEDEISRINFDEIEDGDSITVMGSGDTDNLIFRCVDGEMKIELSRRGFGAIEKLKTILKKSRK